MPKAAITKSAAPARTTVLGLCAPRPARPFRNCEVLLDIMSSPSEILSNFSSFTKVNIAGIKLKLKTLNITVPNAIMPPKTLTGIMFMNKSTAKPAAVASAVYRTGRPTACIVSIIAAFLSLFSL